jgi:N-acetylglutamate synthase-like GNAT family acetyltransferase
MLNKDPNQMLIDAYFKGIKLYAEGMPFDDAIRYQDGNQLDKFSNNFLLLSQPTINAHTIQRYLDTTKSFGFSQFVTLSPITLATIQSLLLPHTAITESLMMMSAPIDLLIKNIQGSHTGVTIDHLQERHESSFLAFNYAMDVAYGEDYAKGNGKRILEVLKQSPQHAGYLIAKQNDLVLGQIGYHRFNEIGEIDEFYVLDAYQHQGIGKSMFLKTIQHLKQLRVQVVILVANPRDEAYFIYQKWGFSDVTSLFQLRIHVKNQAKINQSI